MSRPIFSCIHILLFPVYCRSFLLPSILLQGIIFKRMSLLDLMGCINRKMLGVTLRVNTWALLLHVEAVDGVAVVGTVVGDPTGRLGAPVANLALEI